MWKGNWKCWRDKLTLNPKPRACLNRCSMFLCCTNIVVYFDNKTAYNSRCVEGHDMHNDNLWHQEFRKLIFRERVSREAVFTKGLVGIQNSISLSALIGCILHFFQYRVLRLSYLSVAVCLY